MTERGEDPDKTGRGYMDEKGLGKRLQEARRAAGLTQQILCQKANISYSTLAKIERGAIKSPSIFTIQNLVVALNISMDDLLGIKQIIIDQATDMPRSAVSKNGIKFVYFDVNDCLVHFGRHGFASIATETGASVEEIESIFWIYNDAICGGEMPVEILNKALAKRTGVDMIDWSNHYLSAVKPVVGMDKVIAWVAEHYRVGLLTNTMPDLVPAMLEIGTLPRVAYDVVIDSSVVKAIKPYSEIFEIAAAHAGVEPHEILFIDDSPKNIETAEKLGWQTMQCNDFDTEATARRIYEVLELA